MTRIALEVRPMIDMLSRMEISLEEMVERRPVEWVQIICKSTRIALKVRPMIDMLSRMEMVERRPVGIRMKIAGFSKYLWRS
ncbi:hypothetical protein V8E54_012254 [Elaphomyces granulatus]